MDNGGNAKLFNGTAVLFGAYAPKTAISSVAESGVVTYAFNLGLNLWQSKNILPNYLWITEEKTLLECPGFPGRLHLPGVDTTKVLLPKQLADLSSRITSADVILVDLRDFIPLSCKDGLRMQAAALWCTALAGHESIHCVGFDHFFCNSSPALLRGGFLPPFPITIDANKQKSNIDNSRVNIIFHDSSELRKSGVPWRQSPTNQSQTRFFTSVMPRGMPISQQTSNFWRCSKDLREVFKLLRQKNYQLALKKYQKMVRKSLGSKFRRSIYFLKSFYSKKLEKNPAGLRILFVIPSPRYGATGRYTQVLAEEMVRLGAAVMVLAEGESADMENGVAWLTLDFEGPFLSPGVRRRIALFHPQVIYENGVRSRAQRAALEAVYLTGAHFVMQSEDDDVQIHYFRHGEKAVEGLTSLDKTPVQPSEIARFLGNLDWGHSLNVLKNPAHDRWVEPLLRAACYHLAEVHTAIWHPFAKRLKAQYGKPTLVVPPVCGKEYFEMASPSAPRRAALLGGFQIPPDNTVFFIAGAIYPYSEEYRVFLSAMGMAAKHSTSPLCVVVSGRGWKEAGRIAEEELSPSILFRNLENPDDVRYLKMLQAADIICSPGACDDFTRYRLPSRLVKAMAMGKPILTANWGFGESLKDGVDAFLTNGNNPQDWAKTILNAMDARKREEVGRNGKKFAEENFRAGPVSGKLLALFQEVLNGPRRALVPVRT